MGKFTKYLGKLEMEVDGEKLELDITMQHIQKLLSNMPKDGSMREDRLAQNALIYNEILKRSYPDDKGDELEAFLKRNFTKFAIELAIALKWTTREEINRELGSFPKVCPKCKYKFDQGPEEKDGAAESS
jgi:hypothetical protein